MSLKASGYDQGVCPAAIHTLILDRALCQSLYRVLHEADRRCLDKRTSRDRRAGKHHRGICGKHKCPGVVYLEKL